jgi:hypothetical protein
MPQTSTIAFALIVGFIVFITVRGELPKYLGVVGLGSQPATAAATPSSGSSALGTAIAALPSLFGG